MCAKKLHIGFRLLGPWAKNFVCYGTRHWGSTRDLPFEPEDCPTFDPCSLVTPSIEAFGPEQMSPFRTGPFRIDPVGVGPLGTGKWGDATVASNESAGAHFLEVGFLEVGFLEVGTSKAET